MNWNTIRALFVTHGHINHTSADPFCYIQHTDRAVLDSIADFCQIPSCINSFFGDAYTLFYRDTNCIDFLGHVFEEYKPSVGIVELEKSKYNKIKYNLDHKYYQYIQILENM